MSKQTERLLLRIQQLKAIVYEFTELMENSNGVAGLHLNSNIATWNDLRENGWLTSLDDELESGYYLEDFTKSLGE